MEHVRWLAEPTVRRPKLVAAFTGWNDAGDAASQAVRHLIEAWGATLVGEIDAEEFTDFATIRPRVQLTPERTRVIVWPAVEIWSASTADGDVLLLVGPEPSLRWRLFTEQVLAIVARFEVPLVLTLGALLADVAHTRPVQVVGTASDQAVIDRYDLRRSNYEGPTGIVGVVHDACATADVASASLWAAVPAYASQVPSPKAALSLVSAACQILGTPAPRGPLDHAIGAYEHRVSRLIEDDTDLVGYIARLESMTDDDDLFLDAFDEGDEYESAYSADFDAATDDDEDVTEFADAMSDRQAGDDLMAEVEKFLRDQGDTDPGPR